MRLRSIVSMEGVYMKDLKGRTRVRPDDPDSDLDPMYDMNVQNILAAKAAGSRAGRGGRLKGDKVGLAKLYMDKEYAYKPVDDPSDLIRTEHLPALKKLPKIKVKNSRIGFENASIYYAYAMVPVEGYQEPFIDSAYPKVDAHFINLAKTIKSVYKHYSKNSTPTGEVSMSGYGIDIPIFRLKDLKEFDSVESLEQFRDFLIRYKSYETAEPSPAQLINMIDEIIIEMDKQNVDDLTSLLEKGKGKVKHGGMSRKDFIKNHLRYAAQSIAKKLKNPESPDEAQMSEHITKSAVDKFISTYGSYDIIVIPESSSDYNMRMAEEFKKHPKFANAEIITISKMSGKEAAQDIGGIYENLWNRAMAIQKGLIDRYIDQEELRKTKAFAASIGLTLPKIDMNEALFSFTNEYPEWWAASRLNMIVSHLTRLGDKNAQVKALTAIDNYKQYAQIFKLEQEKIKLMFKRDVLIVDDNVNYSASMQMLHNIVSKGEPKSIMIFTPFYMNIESESDE